MIEYRQRYYACHRLNVDQSVLVLYLRTNLAGALNIAIEKQPMVIQGTLGKMESVWFRDPYGNLVEVAKYVEG